MADIERMFNMMLRAFEANPKRAPTVVDLVICMSQLPPALVKPGQRLCATDPPGRVWEDLPMLDRSFCIEWRGWCRAILCHRVTR